MKVTILRGLPGSGKSTWALASDGLVASADDWFTDDSGYHFDPSQLKQAHIACKARFHNMLRFKITHIVIDNTNTTNGEMKHYVDTAIAAGCDVEIREFKDNFGSVHNVPQATIDRMWKRWEPVKPEWEKYLAKG